MLADPWGTIVRVPLAVSDAASVQVTARIRVAGQHALRLCFSRATVSFEQMARLLGESLSGNGGTPIPIRWEVLSLVDEVRLACGDQITNGSNSWSRREAGRLISFITLSPGRIVLRATVTSPVPEFAGIQSHLMLELPK